jgi:hypothetical protein
MDFEICVSKSTLKSCPTGAKTIASQENYVNFVCRKRGSMEAIDWLNKFENGQVIRPHGTTSFTRKVINAVVCKKG